MWLPFVKEYNCRYKLHNIQTTFLLIITAVLFSNTEANRKYYSEESKQKYNIGNANL